MMRLNLILFSVLLCASLRGAENIKAVGAVSKANIKAIGAVAEANIKAFGAVDNTGGGGGSFFFQENFEGTGYENTWSETGSVIDEDYTTSPLEGAQSLNTAPTAGNTEVETTYTAKDTVHGYLMYRFSNSAGDGGRFNLHLSGVPVFQILFRDDNTVQIRHGSVSANVPGSLSSGTPYHIWYDYTKGTGANGVANIYISTTTTKGSADQTITNGDATDQVNELYIQATNPDNRVWDKIRLSDTSIGDNPS